MRLRRRAKMLKERSRSLRMEALEVRELLSVTSMGGSPPQGGASGSPATGFDAVWATPVDGLLDGSYEAIGRVIDKLAGDANGDGRVGAADLDAVRSNWQMQIAPVKIVASPGTRMLAYRSERRSSAASGAEKVVIFCKQRYSGGSSVLANRVEQEPGDDSIPVDGFGLPVNRHRDTIANRIRSSRRDGNCIHVQASSRMPLRLVSVVAFVDRPERPWLKQWNRRRLRRKA